MIDDKCGTIKTSTCKIKRRTMNDGRILVAAAIEEEFHYEKCCGDESGILLIIELHLGNYIKYFF